MLILFCELKIHNPAQLSNTLDWVFSKKGFFKSREKI